MIAFLTILFTLGAFLIVWIISLRTVVPLNYVHVIQQNNKTYLRGMDQADGNVYYAWPEWLPKLGVNVKELSTEIFNIDIVNYEAYDKDRIPFQVDVTSFFTIDNPAVASQKVSSQSILREQLLAIVRGCIRTILAKSELKTIMDERDQYGDKFTEAVKEQLKEWGVKTVKNIELMDVRDSGGSTVIADTMAIKQSEVEKTSRIAVANNQKLATEAEILAKQEVALKNEDSKREVGKKQAEVTKEVGLAHEKAQQAIKEQAKITKEKEMEVIQVQQVRDAEIKKETKRLEVEAEKIIIETNAQAEKTKIELEAEAKLVTQTKNAEGIKLEGEAKAEAEKQLQLASVTAQTTLAKEVGENEQYQQYLITIRQVEANEKIGIEQAKALTQANLKVIANSNNGISSGINKITDLFSANGGTELAGMLEAFNQSDIGNNLIKKLIKNTSNKQDTQTKTK